MKDKSAQRIVSGTFDARSLAASLYEYIRLNMRSGREVISTIGVHLKPGTVDAWDVSIEIEIEGAPDANACLAMCADDADKLSGGLDAIAAIACECERCRGIFASFGDLSAIAQLARDYTMRRLTEAQAIAEHEADGGMREFDVLGGRLIESEPLVDTWGVALYRSRVVETADGSKRVSGEILNTIEAAALLPPGVEVPPSVENVSEAGRTVSALQTYLDASPFQGQPGGERFVARFFAGPAPASF